MIKRLIFGLLIPMTLICGNGASTIRRKNPKKHSSVEEKYMVTDPEKDKRLAVMLQENGHDIAGLLVATKSRRLKSKKHNTKDGDFVKRKGGLGLRKADFTK